MSTETERIIKNCFEEVGMRSVKDELAKRLFQLLNDKFSKRDKRVQDEYLTDLLCNESYTLSLGAKQLTSCDNARGYYGEKQFVVSDDFKKERGFDTIKGALKYLDTDD